MLKPQWILAGSLVILVGLVWALFTNESSRRAPVSTNRESTDTEAIDSSKKSSEPLLLFCAASNRGVMEAIKSDFEKELGRTVDIQYGASQTLLSSIEVSKQGDLFLPADSSYLEIAKRKGLIDEVLPVAEMHAVVAVAKDNPKNIRSFDDLLRSDVRFVQANPDAAAIGKLTKELLTKQSLWDRLATATLSFRGTVNEAVNDVVVGSADAAIVYDAVLASYPALTSVTIPELKDATSQVSIAIIRSTARPSESLKFARYVAARDRGLKRYAEQGFKPVAGDRWAETPELTIFAGSMLRPAIEDTIQQFESREWVRVIRSYNGCGILVAQMKSGSHPDAYFACDKEFMNSLPDLFPAPVDVSQNELVILVQKGNPHRIATLKDLGKPGIKVGIGHEKQCAMGWLTQNTLREGGIQQEVMANVAVQTPTGDMLVNQLRAGGLDAAVVYLSNAAGAADELDAIPIVGLECSIATQPFAVAVDSPYPNMASRLFEAIKSAESKETFLAEGFRWKLDSSNKNEP